MDKIDKLIESIGVKFKHLNDDFIIVLFRGSYVYSKYYHTRENKICTVGEYKQRLEKKIKDKAYEEFSKEFDPLIVKAEQREELIQLIKSIDTDDAASIANVILRNGWVKK